VLTPGGLQLLIETHGERFIHLAMGILKGWWVFSDHSLRRDSPLLRAATWANLLAEEGFEEVALLPDVEEGLIDRCINNVTIRAKRERARIVGRSHADVAAIAESGSTRRAGDV
jgi:hypothetical protein